MALEDCTLEYIRKNVKGTTLRVYLVLARAKGRNFGVREIQRILELSSVSVASYHLQRLEHLGLIAKTPHSRYQVAQLLPLGDYEDFFVLKGRFLPREVFYLVFFSSGFVSCVVCLLFGFWGPLFTLLFAMAIVATISSWIRFYSLWKKRYDEAFD
ncbi:MAG: winged helix-turn-helix domain-containing protein [Promethearchaeota archaeon]